ncbi:MAG TPA: DUF4230 domain-containing protein [Actinophytocola sp.]|uniref:DUF4230 domain-containing protein n=1 Tax=Actinophytocola sp. TaxID=1872138 RepID=UPI002DDD254E|nr:DUF4230 domain-containing protein [Actinophytocola sp.]HEV2784516.1 DUF4230 domain-containing protein [Actinophytocola sp.]
MATDSSNRLWRIAWVLVAVVVLALGAIGLATLVPNLNPFRTEEIDRTQPALLESIKDLSQYHAAVGEFQVVVDLEKDVAFVPSFLAGERALFVAAGSVNAFVDFSGLTGDALTVSEDRKSVEIRLPPAQLDKPNLNQDRSYLFATQRGIWNRLSSLFQAPDQQQFYQVAEQKIGEAAKAAGLTKRAEDNTRAMLVGMMSTLGYQVTFSAPNT